ncbi:MAG: hypothetical protein PHI71_14540 [Acidiphilium sp.]|nr:hypothetical protein [Acidiphilium sp.]
MTGTMDEDSILDAIDAEERKPQPRQRYPATGLPLLGIWAEFANPPDGYEVRCVLACAHLPGALEFLSNHAAKLVEARIAITWSIREFRSQPTDRRHPRAQHQRGNAEERIIELGY